MEFKFRPPLWVLGQVMTVLRPVSSPNAWLPGDKTRRCICHAQLQKGLFSSHLIHSLPFPLLPCPRSPCRQVLNHIVNLVLILTYKTTAPNEIGLMAQGLPSSPWIRPLSPFPNSPPHPGSGGQRREEEESLRRKVSRRKQGEPRRPTSSGHPSRSPTCPPSMRR